MRKCSACKIHSSGRMWIGVLLICCLILASSKHTLAQSDARIILDTDISSDVDDAGAVAVLHGLANRGQATILAMMTSSGDPWSGPFLAALNASFGRPDIPIGIIANASVTHESKYTRRVSERFSSLVSMDDPPKTALEMYRRVLAGQPDGSVIIITIGYLTNLSRLLTSPPDGYSDLEGASLVKKKVKRLITMGGQFPSGREWNFYQDAIATAHVVSNWPTPIFFSGYEIGSRIKTGSSLQSIVPPHPLRAAYRLFNNFYDRESWDQIAVLLAADPDQATHWELSERGRVSVDADGNSEWVEEDGGPHRFMVWSENSKKLAEIIDRLMLEAAGALPVSRK